MLPALRDNSQAHACAGEYSDFDFVKIIAYVDFDIK
jgi:hypothetical protein